jgi:hypothetical protein
MLLSLKKISINLAVVISLTAFSGADNVRAETISLPLPANDPDIQAIVKTVRESAAVKDIMRQTKERIKEEQAKALPLLRPMGDGISEVISARVRKATRDKTRKAQMASMQDPMNPDGVSNIIAPNFD